MKKTLLNLALVATLASVSAQGVNATAAYDDFKDGNKANPGIDPYSVEQKGVLLWDTLTNAPGTKNAYMGIYWWKKAKTGGLDFTSTRDGSGKSVYTINQVYGGYEPFGVGFGEYAASATALFIYVHVGFNC